MGKIVLLILLMITNSEGYLWRPTNLGLDRKRQLAGDMEYMKTSENNTKQLLTQTTIQHPMEKNMMKKKNIKKRENCCFQLSHKR